MPPTGGPPARHRACQGRGLAAEVAVRLQPSPGALPPTQSLLPFPVVASRPVAGRGCKRARWAGGVHTPSSSCPAMPPMAPLPLPPCLGAVSALCDRPHPGVTSKPTLCGNANRPSASVDGRWCKRLTPGKGSHTQPRAVPHSRTGVDRGGVDPSMDTDNLIVSILEKNLTSAPLPPAGKGFSHTASKSSVIAVLGEGDPVDHRHPQRRDHERQMDDDQPE